MNTTLDFYNTHADSFAADTGSVDFSAMADRFLAKLPPGGSVLDFGCGSGRDTKYFLEKGYRVMAVDGSEELCGRASALTGIEVKQMLFQELDEDEAYDGIWACASILHLPEEELTDVLRRMAKALKPGGVMYISFKYGTFAGMRRGRYFTDLTEETFARLLEEVRSSEGRMYGGQTSEGRMYEGKTAEGITPGAAADLQVEEQWISQDVRPGRAEERWLNLLLRKGR